jgi:tetratricopeptide (TPR) repeat protein
MVKLSGTIGRSVGATAMLVSLLASPSWAKDPFRTSNPKPIGDKTEAAFLSIFKEGNYTAAKSQLTQAEADEPLAYALKAIMAYGAAEGGQNRAAALNDVKTLAGQTFESANRLQDPLRSSLYKAVSRFLEGAYVVGSQGLVRGTPEALTKLQQAFNFLDQAEKVNPQDPELNLIKGYIDLFLSVNINLPLSSPTDAIRRLDQLAQPRYLAQRGLAIGYRDLKQFDQALKAVDQAIAAAPNNPELKYLKAQILVRQGNPKAAVPLFEEALKQRSQLLTGTVSQIERELTRAKR